MAGRSKRPRKTPQTRAPRKKSPVLDSLAPDLRLTAEPQPKQQRIEGLRTLSPTDLLAVADDGRRLFVAGRRAVESYEIIRERDAVRAKYLWKHETASDVRHLVPHGAEVLAALADGQLVRVTQRGLRTITKLRATARALTTTRKRIVAVMPATPDAAARLIALDARSGSVVHEEPLDHDRVELGRDFDETFAVFDRRASSVRHVDLDRRCREPRPTYRPGYSTVPVPDPCPPPPCGCHATNSNANDLKERDKQVEPFSNGGVVMFIATDKFEDDTTSDSSAETLAHELGHKTGFPDLYFAQGYKDDVEYMDGYDIMAGTGGAWPFHVLPQAREGLAGA